MTLRRARRLRRAVDLSTNVGSVALRAPVMTASGTSGHGVELAAYGDLASLGAVVVKSLAAHAWPGNPPPRVHQACTGMLNSVGLQGPGLAPWIENELPPLRESGAAVVVSIWGRSVAEFARAASMLSDLSETERRPIVAIEVNVSCPNVEDRSKMFAHSGAATAEAVEASSCGPPRWAKLSPNVADIREIAAAALQAGAEGLTLVNTLLGMAIDVDARRPVLGGVGGGLSGPPVHPVAVRAVWECREAFPTAAIVGVGGIMTARDALELILAGADAVQVGTASFRDPRAPWKVLSGVRRWCARAEVSSVRELIGAAHGS